MPQTNILKVNDKIFNELFCDGVCEYVTVIFCGETVYMLNQSIVNSERVSRLASGFLFNDFPDKIREEYAL